MNEYDFLAIDLIAEAFEEHGIGFNRFKTQEQGQLETRFSIKGGPEVAIKYIQLHNRNDIAVRIFRSLSAVPAEKRTRVLEACNALNCKYRFLKFSIDTDGDIEVAYDFLQECADECIGVMAFEICARAKRILDEGFGILMKALYTDEPLDL